jgi:hypothetical protein
MMDFANPEYIQSDYMASVGGEQVAGGKPEGSVLHPTTQAKFRQQRQAQQEANRQRVYNAPYQNQPQYFSMPQQQTDIPYPLRSDVAPYTLNYPFDEGNSMAWGVFDDTLSAQATPFKTALATSSLIVLGAVIGEYGLQALISDKVEGITGRKKLPKGIGALFGAIGANAIRMAIASQLSSGWKPALTSLGGGLMPLAVPIAVTFFNKDMSRDKTKIALAIGGLGFLSIPFIIKLANKE